ncbi:MAG: hypothetical protein IJX51_00675 [Clostridia bacterium]|nr:hypothetical protein [Clostridia bacterium]
MNSNEVTEIDVLYFANAKKESAALLPKITDKSATPTDSKISIAQLLDFINRYFPRILPESDLRHYEYDARPGSVFGEDILYQQRSEGLTDYEVLELGSNEIELNGLTKAENDALTIFQDRLARLFIRRR